MEYFEIGTTIDGASLSLVTAATSTHEPTINLKATDKDKTLDIDCALTRSTLFPKLPLELRLEVWGWACCVPRLLDVWRVWHFPKSEQWQGTEHPKRDTHAFFLDVFGFESHKYISFSVSLRYSALQVNQEA